MRFLLLLALLLPTVVAAQAPALGAPAGPGLGAPAVQRPEEIVRWTARVEQARSGSRLRLNARIADGWKVYALDSPPPSPPLAVAPVLPDGVTATGPAVHVTEPKAVYDPNFEATVRSFEGAFSVAVPLRFAAGTASGKVGADVRFTTCNDQICLPPRTIRVAATLPAAPPTAAVGEGLRPSPTTPAPAPAPETPSAIAAADTTRARPNVAPADTSGASALPVETPALEAADPLAAQEPGAAATMGDAAAGREGGGVSWSFLLLALGAGLAALLTPCVFPMLPLTVSFFAREAHGDRTRAVRSALLYGAAIVATYTALGLLLAALVGAGGAGRLAANPWVNLLIGALFVLFGLSLMGLFELRLPARWVNRVDAASRRAHGAAGPLLMGLTLTLVAFSCTVPFVGALLATAARGSWTQPVVGMLAFSLAFAAPFVVLALFPHALQKLPRAGAWMRTLAVTLGFVEIAAALKFLSSADLVWGWGVFTRPVVLVLTIVLLAVAGLYLLGFVRVGETDAPRAPLGVARLLAAVAFLSSALYLVPGLFGANVGVFDAYLPPRRATDFTLAARADASGSGAHDAGWIVGEAGIAQALAEAQASGRPVVVDFTGYTCTNCRFMEANVFPHVDATLQRYVRLRLYTDDLKEGEALQRYQLETTGTVALPTYALLSPDGRLVAQHSGLASVATFEAFLQRGL